MKYEQGVRDRDKFLYHAIQANYDIEELEKVRWGAKSQEEKNRIEDERRQIAYAQRIDEDRLKAIQQERMKENFLKLQNGLKITNHIPFLKTL